MAKGPQHSDHHQVADRKAPLEPGLVAERIGERLQPPVNPLDDHRAALAPVVERYGEADVDEPERLHAAGLAEARAGEIGPLRDLQDLHVLASLVQTTWMVVAQGAQGLRDPELLRVAQDAGAQTARQITWLDTRIKVAAPQALIVAP